MSTQDDKLNISSEWRGVYRWSQNANSEIASSQRKLLHAISLTKMSKFHTFATWNISRLWTLVTILCMAIYILRHMTLNIAVWSPMDLRWLYTPSYNILLRFLACWPQRHRFTQMYKLICINRVKDVFKIILIWRVVGSWLVF